MTTKRKISNGPSKMDLMFALFDHEYQRNVTFVFSREKGEGGALLAHLFIQGMFSATPQKKDWTIIAYDYSGEDGNPTFYQIYYHTDSRTGVIQPTDELLPH